MRHFLSLAVLLILISYGHAQNLVLNPSFENTTTNCTGLMESFPDIVNWDEANVPGADSCSTSDFFSACNFSFMGIGGLSVPGSIIGFQYSRTGTKHIGLLTHELGSEWREYAQGRTSMPLVAGQSYCVSLYVSLANSSVLATNNIGVKFFNSHFQRNACPGETNSLIANPDLNYDCAPITDTTGWTRIQWNYVATGGEQYFVIGNFFDNSNTNIVAFGGTGGGLSLPIPMAYYYIDDVSIVPNSCCYADIIQQSPLCTSDAPVILNAVAALESSCAPTPLNGVWSGAGITNATTGQFSPTTAGPGLHTISYTLPCGSVMTTQIVVSPCLPISVCQNGTSLVASNGVAPYAWQQQITTQDCSACLPAIPPFIAPCSIPAGCAVSVTSWSTFASGGSIPIPTSFPIRVVDTSGTVLLITSLASLPACAACPTITVTNPAHTHVSCFGGSNGSATVSATGSTGTYTYSWMPGNLSGATQSTLAAGTYTVTATDANGCTGTTTVTITQPTTALTLTSSNTPADCGQSNGSASVVASGGTGSYSYLWSPSGGNASTAPALSAGSYTVTVTDANNCTASANVIVSNANGPVVTLVNQVNVTCAAGNNGSAEISIAQGTSPYNISWSPSGGTNVLATNLSAGNYTATITDAGGCIATQNVVITEPTALTLLASAQPADCGLSNGSALVGVSGGTPPYSSSWSPSGGNAMQATGLSPGTYTVTITDSANCTQTASIAVGVTVLDSTLTADIQSTPESCAGNDGTATAIASGGNPPYSYQWAPGTNLDSSSVLGLPAGDYTVTITDACYSITELVTVEKEFTVPPKKLPNIITPNKDNVNDIYTVDDQFESVKDFTCVIYNRWGIAVHKTENKSIMWIPKNITDGTYFILVNYTDCTGKEEKLTSTITVAGTK